MQVKVKKLNENAKLPVYGTDGAACFDIYCLDNGVVTIQPGKSENLKTGLAFEIPEGHVMMVFSRSGHGFKNGIRLSNCTGIIDSDYRGELNVKLQNDGKETFLISGAERVAQAMVVPFDHVEFIETEDLSETERGTGGLGSTGVK